MEKFELKGHFYGPESPIDVILDVNNCGFDIEIPEIPEGDSAYFVVVTISIKSNNKFVPDFDRLLGIVSLNSQTGFEVDAQRDKAINDYILKINEQFR